MAEAPSGPPRKTTTYNRFSTMASQNERYNTKDDEFFWMENIMRVAPHKLHSVPGPLQRATFPPITPPPCTDNTARGQQDITIENAFNLDSPFPGNLRASWGYISNGELYALVGDATCGGGNMTYQSLNPTGPPSCVNIYHYLNGVSTVNDVSAVPIPNPTGPFINTRIGVSDVPCWAAISNAYGGLRVYYDLGNTFVDYAPPSSNFGGHAIDSYAIKDNELWGWTPCCFDAGPPNTGITKFNKTTGALIDTYFPFIAATNGVGTLDNMALTSNYLYFIGTPFAGTKAIYRLNRTTGAVAGTFNLNDISAKFIAVANDDLVYVVCATTPATVYYLENFTDLVYIGKAASGIFSGFGLGTGIWNNGTIYWGSNGFAGFGINIDKMTVACPGDSGPVIATVQADSSSVVAGGSINVTWADILLPDSTDRVGMRPAPSAGDLGFHGAYTVLQTTGAAASGTMAITVPGGTTPGSYIFQLTTAGGAILIATSTPFTVT